MDNLGCTIKNGDHGSRASSEHMSALDHHSSEDNTVLLVIETSERIFAGDYVLSKGEHEGS